MGKIKVAILVNPEIVKKIFSPDDFRLLQQTYQIAQATKGNPEDQAPCLLQNAQACVTSWGSPRLEDKLLSGATELKLVVHAAGSVKPFVSQALWQRKIKVSSAAPVIAIGVAEHALGLMLSAMKRTYWLNEKVRRGTWRDVEELEKVREPYGLTVGIIGLGWAGKCFLKLVKNFEVKILCYDPTLSAEEITSLGGEKVEKVEDLLTRSDVISLHAPSLPETYHLLNASRLRLIKDGAILINTARGSLIEEKALFEELKTGRFTACLDVTDPEPPSPDNPLLSLSNVIFTPHIAGAVKQNLFRIGRFVLRELENFFSQRPLLNEVFEEKLKQLA